MPFAAEMPRARAIGCLGAPFMNRKLHVPAFDHEPVHRVLGHNSADFALELAERCHSDRINPAVRDLLRLHFLRKYGGRANSGPEEQVYDWLINGYHNAMCFVLYAGTNRPLARREWQKDAPDVGVVSLTERDAPVKAHFSSPEVQFIASTSGCGCDFPNVMLQNGEW